MYQWQQELYDGRFATYEKLKRADGAIVFGVLPNGQILLANQEQCGKSPFISALGGRIEEGENPIDAAKRELLEESGYEAENFTLWISHQPTSKIDWAVFVFIAKGLKKVSDQNLDGGEKISIMPVSFDGLLDFASNPLFSEKDVVPELLKARFDPIKYEELKRLFDPN